MVVLQELVVHFSDGQRFSYPAELLRVESPAARRQLQSDTKVAISAHARSYALSW